MKIDAAIFALVLLAAAGAECIPLFLALVAAAGGLTIWKELKIMSHYKTCPYYCGANLDPGERCDCQDEARAKREECERQRRCAHKLLDKLNDPEVVARAYRHLQYLWIYRDNENAAPGATNTQSGKAKQEVSDEPIPLHIPLCHRAGS